MSESRQTHNLNVVALSPLVSPAALSAELPASTPALETVVRARGELEAILSGEDDRLLVVCGPCSIHDVDAALDYADRVRALRERLGEALCLVMRVYFEKPRTTVGWKGLINDPHLDGSFDVETGLRAARTLLLQLAELGVPAGTEFLEPITPQYLADLVSWAAIGARTTESQTHRQMASGLSMPVGFKNGTDGNLQIAIDAMLSARAPHRFLGIDDVGRTCLVETRGNRFGHAILRGGTKEPNYHPRFVADAVQRLEAAGLTPSVMIDCSHANSGKRHERQEVVFRSLIEQRSERLARGERPRVLGAMLESNLEAGSQKLPGDVSLGDDVRSRLRPGVSITDACMGWDETQDLLYEIAEAVKVSR